MLVLLEQLALLLVPILSILVFSKHKSSIIYQFSYLIIPQFLTILFPRLLIQTLVCLLLFHFLFKSKKPCIDKNDSKNESRIVFDLARFLTITQTTICIFLCDFSFWTQRFSKNHYFDIGLMDLGVGCFIFNGGIISSKIHKKKLFKNTMLMFALGIIRLFVVSVFKLEVNEFEYGLHWNFYFTLATINMLFILLNSKYNLQLGIFLLIAYELAYPLFVRDLIFEKGEFFNDESLLRKSLREIGRIIRQKNNFDLIPVCARRYITKFYTLFLNFKLLRTVLNTTENNIRLFYWYYKTLKILVHSLGIILFSLVKENIKVRIGLFKIFMKESILYSIYSQGISLICINPIFIKILNSYDRIINSTRFFNRLSINTLVWKNRLGLISLIPSTGVYLILNSIGNLVLEKDPVKLTDNLKRFWKINFYFLGLSFIYSSPSRRVYNLGYNSWILLIQFTFLLLFTKLSRKYYFGNLALYKFCSQSILNIFLFSNLLVLVFKMIFNLEKMSFVSGSILMLLYLGLNFIVLPLFTGRKILN